jgi:hypothetical protein
MEYFRVSLMKRPVNDWFLINVTAERNLTLRRKDEKE